MARRMHRGTGVVAHVVKAKAAGCLPTAPPDTPSHPCQCVAVTGHNRDFSLVHTQTTWGLLCILTDSETTPSCRVRLGTVLRVMHVTRSVLSGQQL